MSTRVDKGGPKFKPILKSKARPSATPAPEDEPVRPSVEPSVSMPPPSTIPERTSLVVSARVPSNAIVSDNSMPTSVPQTQASRSQSVGTTIVLPRARPAEIQTTRTTSAQQSFRTGLIAPERATTRPVVSIASTSTVTVPSHGVPIASSRSTPAASLPPIPASTPAPALPSAPAPSSPPVPSSSKGKKRATILETEDASEDGPPEPAQPDAARGGVARKRPKLSIVQTEEDRVKRPRRAVNNRAAVSELESGTAGEHREISGVEALQNKRSASKRKKTAEGNPGVDTTGEIAPQQRSQSKRRQVQASTEAEADSVLHDSEPQDEATPPPKKNRKKRRQAETVEPNGTPEPIDPTQVTMSSICDDLGSGRVSSRWETSQVFYAESRKRARDERARAIMEAAEKERETGRAGARKGVQRPTLPSGGEAGAAVADDVAGKAGDNPDEFTYNESLKESHYAPQVRIGANGEVVLDMESLQVDRAADPEIAEETYNFVEESDQSKFINSNSWSKRRSVRWGKEDTAMFYEALRQFGQNFDLIARVLPGRTYRMCKNKFKAEDKKNSRLIDDALKNGATVDLDTLSRMTGKDFSGPTPVIEAKKALDLAEHDANTAQAASGQAEVPTNVPEEIQMPDQGGTSDKVS